jgi:hypothetical protein
MELPLMDTFKCIKFGQWSATTSRMPANNQAALGAVVWSTFRDVMRPLANIIIFHHEMVPQNPGKQGVGEIVQLEQVGPPQMPPRCGVSGGVPHVSFGVSANLNRFQPWVFR